MRKVLVELFVGDGYEENFANRLIENVKATDVVWDVGANRGLYANLLLSQTHGSVHCFEPLKENFKVLQGAFSNCETVVCHCFGLSNSSRKAFLYEGVDPIKATSSVAVSSRTRNDSRSIVEIELRSGDAVVADGISPNPNVIKIDVEGHEIEVLTGMTGILAESGLRVVAVEIHAEINERNGRGNAGSIVSSILKEKGFRVEWLDFSHLIAVRK